MVSKSFNAKLIGCFVAGSVCTLAVFALSISPLLTKLIFALILFGLTFSLYEYLVEGNKVRTCARSHISSSTGHFLLVVVSAVLISTVLLTPTFDRFLYTDWLLIPILSWIRLVAAFVLVFFLPGFLILALLSPKSELSRIERFVFSYILSWFVVPLVSFIFLCIGGDIGSVAMPIILLNIGLLLTYITLLIKSGRIKSDPFDSPKDALTNNGCFSNLYERCTLLFTIAFILVFSFGITLSTPPLFLGDPWRILGDSLRFLSINKIAEGSEIFLFRGIWWPSLLYATFFVVSGSPLINAFNTLCFLNFLPQVAFYMMMTAFFGRKKSKIPIVATVCSLFLGFGWVYYLFLGINRGATDPYSLSLVIESAASKTYDINYNITFFAYYFNQRWVQGAVSLFSLVYLTLYRAHKNTLRYTLVTITFITVYLSHLPEAFIFLSLLLPLLLMNKESLKDSRNFSLSIMIGLSAIGLIDFLAPFHYYTGFNNYNPLMRSITLFFFIYAVAIFFLPQVYQLVTRAFSRMHVGISRKRERNLRYTLVLILFYLYALSFVIWCLVYQDFETWKVGVWDGAGTVPWYFEPMRLGIAGLLAFLTTVRFILSKNDRSSERKNLRVAIILVFIITLLALIFFYFPNIFHQHRIYSFLWIPIPILAAPAIIQVSLEIKKLIFTRQSARVFALTCLFASIVMSGLSSNLLLYDLCSTALSNYIISQEEMDALNYVEHSVPRNVTVFTVSDFSLEKLSSFTSISRYHIFGGSNYANLLFGPVDPASVLYIIGNYGIQYIYLANPYDTDILNNQYSKGFVASHLLQYLPIAFSNPKVTIYRIPPLTPPSSADFAFVRFDPTSTSTEDLEDELSYFLPLETVAFSQIDYSIYLEKDYSRFSRSDSMLIVDGEYQDSELYLQWIEKGGNLLVLNARGHGDFADMLSITSNQWAIANRILGQRGLLNIPETNISILYSKDADVKIIADYCKDASIISTYAFQKNLGKGKIIYLEAQPYLFLVQNLSNDALRRTLFTQLGSLLQILDFPLHLSSSRAVDIDPVWSCQYVHGDVDLSGHIEFQTQYSSPISINRSAANHYYSMELIGCRDLIVNGQPCNTTEFLNSSLLYFQTYGVAEHTFVASNASMVPIEWSYGSYTHFLLFDFTWKIELSNDSRIEMRVLTNGTFLDITVNGGAIKLTSLERNTGKDAYYFLIRRPILHAFGQIVFEKAYLGFSNQTLYHWAFGNSVTINGESSFVVDFSDNSIVILSDPNFSENRKISKTEQSWSESISWTSILTSNILLVLVIFTGAIIGNSKWIRKLSFFGGDKQKQQNRSIL